MSERPSWDDWAMGLAQAVAKRADCSRRQVGAVILDTEHRVVSTGYNGSFPGGPSCLAGDCPRGRHYAAPIQNLPANHIKGHGDETGRFCPTCMHWWPCPDAVAPSSSYDTGPGACIAVHAEANAILFADRERLRGATLYVTDQPCQGCAKLIANTTIDKVVWPGGWEWTP